MFSVLTERAAHGEIARGVGLGDMQSEFIDRSFRRQASYKVNK